MSPEIARAALAFLSRAQLQGAEVPAFVQVVRELEAIVIPAPVVAQPSAAEAPSSQ
jgi:hypothetical protein